MFEPLDITEVTTLVSACEGIQVNKDNKLDGIKAIRNAGYDFKPSGISIRLAATFIRWIFETYLGSVGLIDVSEYIITQDCLKAFNDSCGYRYGLVTGDGNRFKR